MPPRPIQQILDSGATWILVRLLMTFMFWWEGVGFLKAFGPSVPILNVMHLQPAWLWAALAIFIMIGGSLLVIFDVYLWLGTGMMAVFTALTILLVHQFWKMTGDAAVAAWRESEEHVAVIGGLIALTMISSYRKRGSLPGA
jgi:transmembrane protein